MKGLLVTLMVLGIFITYNLTNDENVQFSETSNSSIPESIHQDFKASYKLKRLTERDKQKKISKRYPSSIDSNEDITAPITSSSSKKHSTLNSLGTNPTAKLNTRNIAAKYPIDKHIRQRDQARTTQANKYTETQNKTGLNETKQLGILNDQKKETKDTTSSQDLSSSSGDRTQEAETTTIPSIKGSVPPLKTVTFTKTKTPFISGAYASSLTSCTSASIDIFDTETMTVLSDNPLKSETLDESTSFDFNPALLNVDLQNPTRYLLRATGCDIPLERVITSFYQRQNITLTTTLVSKIRFSDTPVELKNLDGTQLQNLIDKVDKEIGEENTDSSLAYSKLTENSSSFSKITGTSQEKIENSAPDIKTITIPTSMEEKSVATFSAQETTHWNEPSYTIAYQWKLNGVTQSTSSLWTYSPPANSPRSVNVTLLIGKDLGDSNVDTTLPHHEFTYTIAVSDNHPVTAPNFYLNTSSTNPTSDRVVTLDLNTGTSLSNCESFSAYTINESPIAPAIGDINSLCTDDSIQSVNYTITSPGDGDKNIYIWAKDATDTVSVSKSITINVDESPPQISYVSFSNDYRADTLMNINWEVNEAHSSSSINYELEYTTDGSTWTSLPNVASTDGTLISQAFSTSFTLPNTLSSVGQIRMSTLDSLGNTASQVLSPIFEIQKATLGTSPSAFDFGSVFNNSTSSPQTFTVNNTGTGSTKGCSTPVITGPQASEFHLKTDNCSSNTLAANDSCSYEVEAKPISKGSKSATITWTCDLDSTAVNLSFISTNTLPDMGADYSITATEDTVLTFNAVSANDSDSDSLTYTVVTPPSNGSISNCMSSDTDLSCSYTPNANFSSTDTFTYKANDGSGDSATVTTVTIDVTPVNDTPTLTASQTINVTEDNSLSFNLNPGSDIDGDTLSYTVLTPPSAGILNCTQGTSTDCTYTPDNNDINSYSFSYKASDDTSDSNTASVSIVINNTNDAPTMTSDQTLTTNEDTSISLTLTGATDIDPAQTITYKLINAPSNGTLSNCITTSSYQSDLTCDYLPNSNFEGSDSFTYRANDGVADSSTVSTVTINVSAINDAPTLSSVQNISTNEDTPVTFNFNAGNDVENDTLTYIKLTDPSSGSVSCLGGTSQSCTYTPVNNYNGVVSFSYKVNDGSLDSTNATVNITVTPINDNPVIGLDQTITATEDTPKSFTLNAATDVDIPAQTLQYRVVTSPANGALSNCISTGTYSTDTTCDYTPNTNFNGVDSFTYQAYDGALNTISNATVTLNISAVNDAPVQASDMAISATEDTTKSFNLNTGSDIDGDSLTYIIVTNPTNGTLSCADQACTYSPNTDFNGTDSFSYKVNDSSLDSNSNTTVTITTSPVNDVPIMATNQNFTINDNTDLAINLNAASDIDGDTLSYKLLSLPTNGTLSNCISTTNYTSDLSCTYKSDVNFNGTDTFTFIANDGNSDATSFATVTITVNDATPSPPPSVTLASDIYTTQTSQNLTATSCSDTPFILINESTQPIAGDAQWVACTSTPSALTYTLANTTQGIHAIKVWSKDSFDNVSTSPTTINITYDTVTPVIATSSPGLIKGSENVTLSWTLTEDNIDNNRNFTVDYWDGSIWQNITNSLQATSGPHSAQSFSSAWTSPNLDRTDIKFRVSVTDLAGNTTTEESALFEIDSTAPTVNISTPANNSYHLSSTVVSGSCDSSFNVTFSGDIQSTFSTVCSGGTYSQTINFSDNDGTKSVTVSQTDAAGNTGSQSRDFIRDEIAPTMAKTAGVSPDFTNANTPNSWSGTCEDNYTISVTGDETTSFNCSSGTWSWTPSSKTIDGTYSYDLVQTDAAGNTSSPALTLAWQRDATPPVFDVTTPVAISSGASAAETKLVNQVSLSGSCEGTNIINITGAQTDAVSCSSSTWSWTSQSFTTDATRSFTFTQSDSASNTSALTYTWTRDSNFPALVIDKASLKSNTDTVTFTGSCEDGLSVDISGDETSTATCSSGIWSWTSSTISTDATRSYNFEQTNVANNTTTTTGTWIRETDLPTISAFSSSTASPTSSAIIPIDINAASANPNVYIDAFCVKSDDTTPPLSDDSCFIGVNSSSVGQALAQTLVIDEYSQLLGWINKAYDVYVWVKDEAGNISTLSNSGTGSTGVDTLSMSYAPGVPPSVFDVAAGNTDLMSLPATRAQSSAPAGTDLYIIWKATDDNPLPGGAVTLFYTTDEINFTQIVTNIPSTNNGCESISLEANQGCYKWTGGSPLSTSYKIQVKITDASGLTAQITSTPINADMIKIIAGNTEAGLNGSAQTALFYTRKYGSEADPGTLVVTNDGHFFINDYKRGILTINPNDGKQKVFIPNTGTSTGDGGPAQSATLRYATKIALDFQGRLLIHDTNRIRRVDLSLSNPTIDTIIGGGADTSDTVSNPLDVSMSSQSSNSYHARTTAFFAMPNGDIYFHSESGYKSNATPTYRVRVFKASTGQVVSKYFTGTGNSIYPTQDLSKCRMYHPGIQYDPETSTVTGVTTTVFHHASFTGCDTDNDPSTTVGERYTHAFFDPSTFNAITNISNDSARYYRYFNVTMMNGKVYRFIDRSYLSEVKYDGSSPVRVIGTGTRGVCPDGTAVTSCNMDLQDVFITPNGKTYLLEGGQIRTIDENGNIVTLFGQRRSYGDGVNALNARFDVINTVKRLNDGKVIVGDSASYYIKEFSTEGNINIIAGNGNSRSYPNLATAATSQGLYDATWFAANKATGEIFTRAYAYGRVAKLNRSTGLWEYVVGTAGSVDYWNLDGQDARNRRTSGNQGYGLVIGFDGTNLLTSNMKYNNTELRWEDFMYKLIDTSDSYRQRHLAGTNGAETYTGGYEGICTSGSVAASCKMPYYSYMGAAHWDTTSAKWYFARDKDDTDASGKEIWSMKEGGTVDFVTRVTRNIDNSYMYQKIGSDEFIYYCHGGRIYKHNIASKAETALTWPVSNLSCVGHSLEYNPDNNSIIFPFTQNGLYGVAEYFLP